MACLRATVAVTGPVALVSRPYPNRGRGPAGALPVQTLILQDVSGSKGFAALGGTEETNHGCVGPVGHVLSLQKSQPPANDLPPGALRLQPPKPAEPYVPQQPLRGAAYEPKTGAVYFAEGYALMRLNEDDTVAVVAGRVAERGVIDGVADIARFDSIVSLAADGEGGLLVADEPEAGDGCGNGQRAARRLG
ncbi:hypothetical protein GPECTOR_20g569 [Gonium pectorale]|uniref:Uncharacterized protein n=1 Tax=Gonium pectorale TaxID=33097 RepID=A0A150GIS8_GONPE|nr:hypothetical protein GPECTOR_20g569 [Gonium pectorale]|eukprot:KXZ49712.1 hypothetical protein GPECTOR_20g569 [Gonium pectorale]